MDKPTSQASGATAWVELIASTGFKATHITVSIESTRDDASAAGVKDTVDIAFGAAASEVEKFKNLISQGGNLVSEGSIATYDFPFDIPAGTRISFRTTGAGTGGHVTCRIIIKGP